MRGGAVSGKPGLSSGTLPPWLIHYRMTDDRGASTPPVVNPRSIPVIWHVITSNPYHEHLPAFHRYHYPMNRNPLYTEASVTKQEKTALNMARFIRSQTLTLLEKLNELDADEQADICESLHDHADELYRSCLARFGDDGENL